MSLVLMKLAISNLYSFSYLCFISLKYQCSRYFCKTFHMEDLPSYCNLWKKGFWNMVYISAKSRQIKLRFQNFTIGTNTFLRIRNFLWGFTAPLHTQIWLCFHCNLATILRCLPVLGKTGMLNLNFMSVFDMFHGR